MDQLECSHQTWSSLEEAIECLGTASIAMDSLVGEDECGEGACALTAPSALPLAQGLEVGVCP